jgi:hypothetical protein
MTGKFDPTRMNNQILKINLIMNKYWILIIGALITFSACENENQIIYPDQGNYGDNILKMDPDTIHGTPHLSSNNPYYYSMFAEVGEEAYLEIIMDNTSEATDAFWSFETSSRAGWIITDYEGGKKRYIAYGPIVCDLQLTFYEKGSAVIEFYENHGEEPLRTKTLVWDY